MRHLKSSHNNEKGQSTLVVFILLAVVLLGVLGLATDYTQVWAHRQMTQAAADAACQAGAADLFLQYTNPSATTSYGIDFSWIGTDYQCTTNVNSPPCQYAAKNGYSGSKVAVSFPSSVAGTPNLSGFGTIAHPYIQVTITQPVQQTFARLITRLSNVNTGATAVCGLNPVAVPVPLVVLHQTSTTSLSTQGNPTITILGGPNRSIQVDSSSTTAVNVGGSASVDLHLAGPNGNGADFGVFGQEAKPAGVNLGSGQWVSPGGPFGDPWVTVAQPAVPASAGAAIPQPFNYHGCPDPNGCVEFTAGNYASCSTANTLAPGANGCLMIPYGGSNPRFTNGALYPGWTTGPKTAGTRIIPTAGNAGGYLFEVKTAGTSGASPPLLWSQIPATGTSTSDTTDGGVTWTNIGKISNTPNTAIFAPGIFYVGANGLNLGSNSTVRMSTASGDGTSGTTFFFSTAATVVVASNAGNAAACTSVSSSLVGTPNGCVVSYKVDGTGTTVGTFSVLSRPLQCPAAGSPLPPASVPSSLNGNVLLGPCSGTMGDSAGQNRGFLFFQSRTQSASPSWGGGGQFLLSGFMYFHSNSTSTGTTCGTSTSCLSLSGNSGAGAYTLGNIVADKVSLGGSSGIKMVLNPNVTFQILRPQLLR
jgi:hypothetical protein